MSTYFPNIPEEDDNPTDSQEQIKSNFNAILNAQNRNHVNFSEISDSGRHEVIQIQEQADDPTPISGFGDLFVRRTGSPLKQNLFFLDDASNLSQLTNAFTSDTNGEATLPGGLQFQWGTKNNVPNEGEIEFTEDFKSPAFNVQISEERDNNSVRSLWIFEGSITDKLFKIRTSDTSGRKIKWFAIGLKLVT